MVAIKRSASCGFEFAAILIWRLSSTWIARRINLGAVESQMNQALVWSPKKEMVSCAL